MIFDELPPDFDKKFDVVGCFLEHKGKFVLLHRQNHKANGGTWGKPAGKVDPGETLSQAIKREVFEETGVDFEESQFIYSSSLSVRHDDIDFVYHMFSVKPETEPSIKINPLEHQDYQWVTPAEAMNLDLIRDLDICIKIFYDGFSI